MCSLPHYGGLSILGPRFGGHKSVADGTKGAATPSKDGKLWTRLVRAAGKPGAAFERLVEDFNYAPDQDSAARKSIEERKILLNVQLQGVCLHHQNSSSRGLTFIFA